MMWTMRFEAKSSSTDFQHYGVWDSVLADWRTAPDRDRATAEQLAVDLNAQFTATGPRRAVDVRWVRPARRAEARVIAERWRPGDLDLWIREVDGWYGHIWLEEGLGSWWPADRLRPLE